MNVQSPDGSNCTDNNLCTSNDTCYAGTCVGLPKSCGTHSNQCKSLQCDPKTGELLGVERLPVKCLSPHLAHLPEWQGPQSLLWDLGCQIPVRRQCRKTT